MALLLTAPDRALWEVLVAVVFLQAGVAWWVWKYGDLRGVEVFGLALAGRAVLFPLRPTLSDDAYRYIWDGLVQHAGFNPYALPPAAAELEALHGEWIFSVLNSQAYVSVYPPVSQALFFFGGLFYGAGWEASYYALKAVLVAAELGGLALLARLVSSRSLLLYAWHPVVLLETAGQAHTEGIMILGLLLCVWAYRRHRPVISAAALSVAVWVKLYPVFLVPFLLRRIGWRYAGVVAGVSLPLVLVYYEPGVLDRVAASIDLYVRLFEFNAGPYYALKAALTEWTGRTGWSKILGPMLRQAFVLVLPLLFTLDWWRSWSLPRAGVVVFGTYLALATTVHPWYLLPILCLAPLLSRPPWAWLWLSTVLVGTYLFYTTGLYWPFVIGAWVGWLVLGLWARRRAFREAASGLFEQLLRFRGVEKWRFAAGVMPGCADGKRVLDLGAGEGFVGEAARKAGAREVVLADVIDLNRTALRMIRYDGQRLPLADDTFDVTLLVFVLHHAESAEAVFTEALRVSRAGVLVVESTYETRWNRRLLDLLDRLANRLRSRGRMREQELHLHFRQTAEWADLFESLGGRVRHVRRRGRWVHQQSVFWVERTDNRGATQ